MPSTADKNTMLRARLSYHLNNIDTALLDEQWYGVKYREVLVHLHFATLIMTNFIKDKYCD